MRYGFITPWARVEVLDDNGSAASARADQGYLRIRTQHALAHALEPGLWDTYRRAEIHGSIPATSAWLTHVALLFVPGRTTNVLNIGGEKISQRTTSECFCMANNREFARQAHSATVGSSGLEEVWALLLARRPIWRQPRAAVKQQLSATRRFQG